MKYDARHIEVRLECQIESLKANLSISNDHVQKVKSDEESDKWL